MHTTVLREVDGAVVLALPAAILDRLRLVPGTKVDLAVDNGRLVIEPQPRPRYTLTDLLAVSDYSEPQPPHEREWVDAAATGREPL